MIYFIQAAGGPIKIGRANSPGNRLYDLQVGHYEKLTLLAVQEGGRNEERNLHERFAFCRRLGEWFEPTDDLLAYISGLPRLAWSSTRTHLAAKNAAWKGDEASYDSKHDRLVRRMPVVGPCEDCGHASRDRKFRDGDANNFARENIVVLCRRCSMRRDGRMEAFTEQARTRPKKKPPAPCTHCHRLWRPRRRGRCPACAEYLRRHGVERPLALLVK